MDKLDQLLDRAATLLSRLEELLPGLQSSVPDWSVSAYRWQRRNGRGTLHAVHHLHKIVLSDLQDIAQQKERVEQNTRQFVQGKPANNVLLTGARGTGKSSLVKALLNEYAAKGLRLIEIDKAGLADLPEIIELVSTRSERFILYCDDLSFSDEEPGYQALKAALDGSLVALSDNLLIYATSNRRHLMPEYMQENLATKYVGDEVHPAEGVEEKISLSERFGLWVSFYPFTQEEYLTIAAYWVKQLGGFPFDDECRQEALRWALMRGSRSGRVAGQFARDWVGRK
ncbi:MAG: ATP-binding protein [Gallionellaceae bacterium]|jgi:predicted AAA+ superfamily ATPase